MRSGLHITAKQRRVIEAKVCERFGDDATIGEVRFMHLSGYERLGHNKIKVIVKLNNGGTAYLVTRLEYLDAKKKDLAND